MGPARKSDPIAIASDHAGHALKVVLARDLERSGYSVIDLGTNGEDSVDYPVFADSLARAVEEGVARWGVLMCGSGIGASIAANRHHGVRAALCHGVEVARLSREHNDANVLVLGGRLLDTDTARRCLETFLATGFEDGGRHARRVAMLG